jgi:hypothetical protein
MAGQAAAQGANLGPPFLRKGQFQMAERIKTIMRAPDHTDETNVLGSTYWPDEDGLIETTNDEHVEILTRFGYSTISKKAIGRPSVTMGPIDVDELGRQGLTEALRERGLSFPDQATRDDLVAIADAWNVQRRRAKAVAATAESEPDPMPEQPKSINDAPDFSAAGSNELRGWLAARGVAAPATMTKVQLRKAAEDHYVQMTAPKAEA